MHVYICVHTDEQGRKIHKTNMNDNVVNIRYS